VWIVRAGQIGAYRERYHFPDTMDTMLPGGQRGEQARARAWVLRFLAENPLPDEPVESRLGQRLGLRTTRLREQFSALTDRLGQPTAGSSDIAPKVGTWTGQLEVDVGDEPDHDPWPEL
jgi:hypothetical protein